MALDLPESLSDAWQRVGTRTAETTVMMATITAETTLYEPTDGAGPTRIDAGPSDVPLRSLFTVEMTFSPPLPSVGVSPASVFSMAAPTAKSQFVDTIENEGLVVERTRDTLEFEAPNGAAGKWYVLDASYPLESGDDGEAATALPAEAHVAVWPTERSYGMAGGTVPLSPDGDGSDLESGPPESLADGDGSENPEDESSSDRRGPDRDLEFDLDPDRDRETVAALIRNLEA
ncbi:hypothetical protein CHINAEXTREME_08060 [Halobiforma lacisalsi AJ5]|uniref:Uncharacterized protein n=1 Tax=Natronobacterium lacisalsi AJ5 TaxID=358396 RepID=M0LZJ7_NATLA|nr:hypothetical protein [Halobiforma lacisalsi]APW97732.1 hypothetical protein CHINAEXTREME_08060 [Halobiforma lacisalsi AJ5]EMA37525.1 hypothetical protein C445_01521 [Halobiforma lacisalsi AJ5]